MGAPGFDQPVAPGGYLWWYIDAISDDGQYGLTIIAFVGSVFSPYYALARGLKAAEIGGAGLDVYEHGTAINPLLRELPNVVLLPHMGSATIEGRIDMGEKVIVNVKAFMDGHRPPDRVLPNML